MSEPARCYSSRDAEQIKHPPTTELMTKLLSGSSCETSVQQQQQQPPPAGTTTSASPPSSNFYGKATKGKTPQDPPPSVSTASSSQKHKGRNANTTKSRGGGGNSVAGSSGARSMTASSKQPSEQRGAIEYLLANYHPGQSLSSVCSPRPPKLSSSSLPPSSSTSSRRNLPPTLSPAPTTTIVCRRNSTDPPSQASHKQLAEISISGSSWSTYEDVGGGIVAPNDPPSRDGGDSSFSTSSSSILRLRRQKKKKQLQQQKKMGRSNNMASFETLNEGDEDDENGDEGDDDYVAQERRSIASNSEQHSMDDLEDGSHSTSSSDDSDAIDESAELSSAVRMELGIRKKISNNTSSTTNTTDCDDAEDGVSRAIVTVTPTEQQRNDNGQNGKLFLASAVNNYTGLVPINSTIYEAYDHTFVSCPEYLRFRFLFTFLKKNLDKKIMIFFSTTNSAKFHAKILAHFHIPVLVMHGKQRREKFINRFFKFSDMDEGILCATDAAGRDLDIPPSVDWVIQYEPPDDPSEYILRVARISCNSDRVGRSLLFLNPGEKGFLKYYHSASIPVSEFEIPTKNLAEVQDQYEYHVNESERLCRYARDAYGSYLIAYASHGFRDVYNVHDLNKDDVGMSFGLVRGLTTPDDATADTDTLMNASSSYVGGVELGHDPMMEASKRRSNGGGAGKRWEKKEKRTQKTWMKGEKSWPHSSIKMHPKFKGGGSDVPESVRF